MLVSVLDRYRRAGADLPWGDPARTHGTAFEGWFWRLTLPEQALIVLHGVSRAADGSVLGTHGLATASCVRVVGSELAAPAGSFTRIAVSAGPDAWIDAHVEQPIHYPHGAFGGLGLAQVVPGLNQYWHPVLLGGRVRGTACVGGTELELEGATIYAEKNWGPSGFPPYWWWGSAQGFCSPDVCVAFAGGRASVGPLAFDGTAIVARVGPHVVRAAPPLQRVEASVGASGWRVRGGGITLEGTPGTRAPVALPIPVPATGKHIAGAASQHLDGVVTLRVQRRGRLLFAGSSHLAGLERGSARGDAECLGHSPVAAVVAQTHTRVP